MATTIQGKVKDSGMGGYNIYSQIFTNFDNSYDWIKVVKSSDGYTHDCYITDSLYLRLSGESIGSTSAKFNVSVCGTFGTKLLYSISVNNCYITWCFTKTSKGFSSQLSSSSSGYNDYGNYNVYIGDCTLNGQTVKGCIYVDDSGNLTIATDNGISTETALGTTINADRKAVLVPIANTTTGEIFSDIFVMRYSPLQYNIMDVDGHGVFLCGKTLALKD